MTLGKRSSRQPPQPSTWARMALTAHRQATGHAYVNELAGVCFECEFKVMHIAPDMAQIEDISAE